MHSAWACSSCAELAWVAASWVCSACNKAAFCVVASPWLGLIPALAIARHAVPPLVLQLLHPSVSLSQRSLRRHATALDSLQFSSSPVRLPVLIQLGSKASVVATEHPDLPCLGLQGVVSQLNELSFAETARRDAGVGCFDRRTIALDS